MSGNPFDDLEGTDDEPEPESKTEPVTETAPRTSSAPTPTDTSGPAFEYSDVRQRPLYARDDTWNAFERTLRTDIGPFLAANDVLDEEKREIHDALLRLALENPERLGELIIEARKGD